MSAAQWISAHAFYQGQLDHLLLDAVHPLVSDLTAAGGLEGYFFLRYWERGPHLRLRVLPRRGADRAEIERLIVERFRRFFAEHPSQDMLKQEDYDATASTLAGWEHLDSYAGTLHANNALSFIPYRREHERYGDGVSIEAVERHFVESSRLALRILTAHMPLGRRLTAAYAMMLLAWFVGEPDPERLLDRVRPDAHLGPFTEQSRSDLLEGWRQDHAEHTARQMRELACSVASLPGSGTLVEWARSVQTLYQELSAHARAGAVIPHARGRGGGAAGEPPDTGAGVLPVLDICAHLVCNRLGVPLHVEGALRRQAAEAIKVLIGEGSRSRGLA